MLTHVTVLSIITHFSSVAVYHHLFSLSLWFLLSWESFKGVLWPISSIGSTAPQQIPGHLEERGCL